MRAFLVCWFIGFIVFFTNLEAVYAQVWNDVNTWTPEVEKTYEKWVQKEWTVDFFARKNLPDGSANPYYRLRTDCADTVYSMRIIFSYQHKLPFAAKDPTGGQGLVTNRMTRWNSLSTETERIRQFLLFVYDAFSTETLPSDTYPVAISRETVHAGGLMATVHRNHHSWTIQDVLPIGVPHLIYNSTIGAASGSMLQQRSSYPNPGWVFEGNFSPSGDGGFRYWRAADDLNKPVWKVKGYSEEQYRIPLNQWIDVVQSKLALTNENDEEKILRLLDSACAGAKGRVTSVNEGTAFLKTHPACMSFADYDTYSTPNRDRRVFDDLVALRRAYAAMVNRGAFDRISGDLQAKVKKIYPAIELLIADEQSAMAPSSIDGNSACSFQYGAELSMDLAEYRRRSFAGLLSNNPNDPFEVRWGLQKGPSAHAKSCQSWDNWAPDLSKEN